MTAFVFLAGVVLCGFVALCAYRAGHAAGFSLGLNATFVRSTSTQPTETRH